MRGWLRTHSSEIKQLIIGIVVFALLAGVVVAYSTPIQDRVAESSGAAATFGVIFLCVMIAAAFINYSRFIFLIAVPLVLMCAIVWVLLTVRTVSHFDFYTTNIARSVSHIPEPIPEELSELTSEDRKQFQRAPRQLSRSAARLQHHLDRHAFWCKTLLAIIIGTIAVGLLPKILRGRAPPSA